MDLAVEVTRLRFMNYSQDWSSSQRCFVVLLLQETAFPDELVTSAASRSEIQTVQESVRFDFGVLVKPGINWGSRFRLLGRLFLTEHISGRDIPEKDIAVE